MRIICTTDVDAGVRYARKDERVGHHADRGCIQYDIVISVSYTHLNRIALLFEFIQIIYYFAAEERASIFQCRFVDDNLCPFCLYPDVYKRQISSINAVPPILVFTYFSISYIDCPVPVSAAK